MQRFIALCLLLLGAASGAAWGFELQGERRVWLHARDGSRVEIARVVFTPGATGAPANFALKMQTERFTDHFLSMREFKCLPGQGEVFCHVPYPYAQPGTVTREHLAWLEHSLLFMFKLPAEFGAKLWNGVYYQLRWEGDVLVGRPQAVDLNFIGAPPARLDVPPFRPALRDDIRPDARWFNRLTIE